MMRPRLSRRRPRRTQKRVERPRILNEPQLADVRASPHVGPALNSLASAQAVCAESARAAGERPPSPRPLRMRTEQFGSVLTKAERHHLEAPAARASRMRSTCT